MLLGTLSRAPGRGATAKMADEQAQVSEAAEKMSLYDDPVLLAALQTVLEDRPSVVQELADWMLPDRAYGNARVLQDGRLTGTVKSYNEPKGYGFIDCPEVKEAFGSDVFLHRSQVADFVVGQQVSFAILVNKERKPQAFDLGPSQNGKDMKKASGKGPVGKGAASAGKAMAARAMASAEWASPAAAKGAWGAWGPDAWMAEAAAWKGGGWDASWKGAPAWGLPAGKGKNPWADWAPAVDKGKGKGGGAKGSTERPARGPPGTSTEIEGVTDIRHEGTIKSFNETRGFGFIQCDVLMEQFGADVFLHKVQFQGFEVGQEVSFEVFLNKDGKPQGKELLSADGQPGVKKMKFI